MNGMKDQLVYEKDAASIKIEQDIGNEKYRKGQILARDD